MKAHLIDTHLLVPRSRSSAKVKVKYQGHVSQKMGVSGALVFHKHILFLQYNVNLVSIPPMVESRVNLVLWGRIRQSMAGCPVGRVEVA